MDQKTVLFLCTGNSVRSQMAEAMTNALPEGKWKAFSAGTVPAGFVHPMALRVLEEAGIHHQGVSKSVDVFKGQSFDLVVTVCSDAEENCPVWLGKGRKLHISLEDPGAVKGDEETRLNAFRQTREEIRKRILPVLTEQAE
jgi:arsenate reductase